MLLYSHVEERVPDSKSRRFQKDISIIQTGERGPAGNSCCEEQLSSLQIWFCDQQQDRQTGDKAKWPEAASSGSCRESPSKYKSRLWYTGDCQGELLIPLQFYGDRERSLKWSEKGRSSAMIGEFLIKAIEFYQRTLSPDHGPRRSQYPFGYCKYTPSCSEYCKQAIQKHGPVAGTLRGVWRILRCNPWSKGGSDPA